MRSTIFISVFAVLASLQVPTTALAGGPVAGCYDRSYTLQHLKQHPDQFVARIRLWLDSDDHADISVWTANQGHARRDGQAGQRFDSYLVCWEKAGAYICGIECDGGHATITVKDNTLDLTTERMWIGEIEDCGGAIDLAERPMTAVTYRMTRVADAACSD